MKAKRCSFDTFLRNYDIADPPLEHLALIRYLTPGPCPAMRRTLCHFAGLSANFADERITPPADVQTAIDERIKPGMVFVTTDQPATPDTRSGKEFTVMDAEGK
jgi:hypothetical protein